LPPRDRPAEIIAAAELASKIETVQAELNADIVSTGHTAPDLRKRDRDCAGQKDAAKKASCVKEMDGYFIGKVRRGVSRNGAVQMPPFDGILQQEAVWAIKSDLETRREKPL
jgi:hypothetical protein